MGESSGANTVDKNQELDLIRIIHELGIYRCKRSRNTWTDQDSVWRYSDSANNPADDLTWGWLLQDLVTESWWNWGPALLQQLLDHWPITPAYGSAWWAKWDEKPTLSALCITSHDRALEDPSQFNNIREVATALTHHSVAKLEVPLCEIWSIKAHWGSP